MSRRWPGTPLPLTESTNQTEPDHSCTPEFNQLVLSPTQTIPSLQNKPQNQNSRHSNGRFSLPQVNLISPEMILSTNPAQSTSAATGSSQQVLNYRTNSLNNSSAAFDRSQDDHRKRKRNRTMQSCLPCHTNKRKCDRGRPCKRCTGLGTTGNCVYETEDPKFYEKLDQSDPAWEVGRLRERIAELEGVVRCLKGRPNPKQRSSLTGSGSRDLIPSSTDPSSVLPSPTIYPRQHSHSVSGVPWSPASTDTGHQAMLEIFSADCGASSSSAGSLPPSPSFDSVTHHPQPIRQMKAEFDGLHADSEKDHSHSFSPPAALLPRHASCPPGYLEDRNVFQDDDDGPKVFLGNGSGGSIVKKLNQLTSPSLRPRMMDHRTSSSDERSDLVTVKAAYMGLFGAKGIRWAFDDNTAQGIVEILYNIVPDRERSQQLLDIFLQEVDCFYHGWHTPTVVGYYTDFFNMSIEERQNFPKKKLSVIIAIITVTIDLSPHLIVQKYDPERDSVASYREKIQQWQSYSKLLATLTVDCLKKASYLGHPSLECIQAQLILLIYMVNNGRCSDAWCFTGGFIKQAQCLGLHIDPHKLQPGLPLLEKEIRRRIWWAIQTWDTFLSIAFGWPAGVTSSETDLPQDRTEDSLLGSAPETVPPPLPEEGVTEMSYHVYNWEACQYAHHMLDRIFHHARWKWRESDQAEPRPKYTEIEALDKIIRTWYKKIPSNMRFEPEPIKLGSTPTVLPDLSRFADPIDLGPSSSFVSATDVRLRAKVWAKQALMLAIYQNSILFLLHRPFIGDAGHSSSKNLFTDQQLRSQVKCLRSSQVIIEAQKLLVDLFPATRRMWYGWYKTFHAAMTSAWIAQLHPHNHSIFEVGKRCLELAIEAYEMCQDEPADQKEIQDGHLQACVQLKAIKNIISRSPDSEMIPSAFVLRASGTYTDLSPNPNTEWAPTGERGSYGSVMGQGGVSFISPSAFFPHTVPHGYSPYPATTFTGSPLSPEDGVPPQTLHPSPPSAHGESAAHSSREQDSYDHHSSTNLSSALPRPIGFNHSSSTSSSSSLYQTSTQPSSHTHPTSQSDALPLPRATFTHEPNLQQLKAFLPNSTNLGIYGPSHTQVYTPPHAFGSMHYPADGRSQMSMMLTNPDISLNNNALNRFNTYPSSSTSTQAEISRVGGGPSSTTTTEAQIHQVW
ncbi:hypothetical protein CROQUDRAFT_673836 [Cronartium quercuum f. sp. fusiforme G11]|uniref:Zn(2)-C6 fungal-type domain-containing protein n=1 Tax=Cronartium quercuum f. sp. fusiforme G11 TaxID=708437 RepID=A0A9P6NE19_9BASI|nr:hypothetical protein CROQUDRAFT_673836 [Cronartium quercuum f. sp. fusiforme G11]